MPNTTKAPIDCDPQKNLQKRDQLTRLADFLYEAGMLKKTPRSGFQFLGSGQESVAEHSCRTAMVGYVLASMAGANAEHTALLCLFHDFQEARIGDVNYVGRMYMRRNQREAFAHAVAGTGLEKTLLPNWDEGENGENLETRLVHDADQIDLILSLREEEDLGNPYAKKWIEAALPRLCTKEGKALAARICEVDHTDWWFAGPDASWWTQKHGEAEKAQRANEMNLQNEQTGLQNEQANLHNGQTGNAPKTTND